MVAFGSRARGSAVVHRGEREASLDHVGVEPVALRLELVDGDRLQEVLLLRERRIGERLHTRDARLQRLDARGQGRELLGPIVTRALHFMMTALRLAELPIEIAEALLLRP